MKRQLPVPLVVAPALLIAAAVAFFFLVKPQMDEGKRLEDRAAELQQQVDVAMIAQRVPTPEQAVKVADVFRLTRAMPDTADMAGVLLELKAVADAAGVEFLAITPGPAVARDGGFQSIPIELTFEGNYYDLTDVLFRLRNLVIVRDGKLDAQGRLFTLDTLGLSEGPDGFPQIQAGLSLSAYVYAPAPAAPAAPEAAPSAPGEPPVVPGAG